MPAGKARTGPQNGGQGGICLPGQCPEKEDSAVRMVGYIKGIANL